MKSLAASTTVEQIFEPTRRPLSGLSAKERASTIRVGSRHGNEMTIQIGVTRADA